MLLVFKTKCVSYHQDTFWFGYTRKIIREGHLIEIFDTADHDTNDQKVELILRASCIQVLEVNVNLDLIVLLHNKDCYKSLSMLLFANKVIINKFIDFSFYYLLYLMFKLEFLLFNWFGVQFCIKLMLGMDGSRSAISSLLQANTSIFSLMRDKRFYYSITDKLFLIRWT